ncbi:hypothetical protein [Runella sp.]|uniref:hypothetical protein n=1 Tax=Runella sp. TaxID=1960881 RepID=UPI003D11567E
MSRKVKTAIESFEDLRSQISKVSDWGSYNIWETQLNEHYRQYFGVDTPIINNLKNLTYSFTSGDYFDSRKFSQKANHLLDTSISLLKTHGVAPKLNFIHKINNEWLIAIITVIIPILIGIGFNFGIKYQSYDYAVEKMKIQKSYDSLLVEHKNLKLLLSNIISDSTSHKHILGIK